MFEFGLGTIYVKGSHGWQPVGTCTSMVMTLEDGRKMYSGAREEIFDLEQTAGDRELLSGMKIGT